ncbi:glycosyltransferase family 4 protein [Algibacter miyuki]|uniref:Glycosyltransferase family 4 protein n=2 Tax=Algibacter miyuki TaxID=1306933 RepID=A0ABV5GX45_9FLAO|nr:glycosyltransferase [Algibacter miyuki]
MKNALPNSKLTLLSFQFPFTNKTYDWNGIEIIPLNGKNKLLKKLCTWKKALNILKKIHREQPIDTIHSFWIGECAMIGERFSIKHHIKHVVTLMGQDAKSGNLYTKKLTNSTAKIVTLSINHQSELLKNHKLKSTIIPWHLNTKEFPELSKNNIDILGVGSVNSIKNYAHFINVISQLIKVHTNLNVVIIGDGAWRNELEQLIKKSKLSQTVTLKGKISRHEVLKNMAQSKLLLHTSLYESFGFVFLEALYSGMQIVSYDVGLAKTSTHWKVCNSETALVAACQTILSEKTHTKNRILISSEKQTINAYLNLYNA